MCAIVSLCHDVAPLPERSLRSRWCMGERGVCKHLCKASRSVCMHFFVVAAAVGCVRCAFVYAVLHCLRQYCELDFHGDAAAAACASEWCCLCASTPGLRGAGYLSFGRLCARCAREFHMRARALAYLNNQMVVRLPFGAEYRRALRRRRQHNYYSA